MKVHYFKFMLVVIALAGLTLTSCKKTESAADQTVSAQDLSTVTNAMHSTSDDAAAAAGQVSSYKSLGLGGNWNTASGNLLIDATITDTNSSGIVIVYAGTVPCNGITRQGTVTITNTGGLPWHEAGAQLTITYTNLMISDQVTGNTYTLNGTHVVTNVSGGLAWQVMAGLAPNTTVTHQIQTPAGSNMTINFPNGTTRTWTVNRTRSWSSSGTGSNQTYTVTVFASPGSGNVTETGTNRFGDGFTNSITNAIVATNLSCELWKPYTGTWTHVVGSNSLNVQFGTNSAGTQVGTASYCGTAGEYGYYITLTRGSGTRNRFVSYW